MDQKVAQEKTVGLLIDELQQKRIAYENMIDQARAVSNRISVRPALNPTEEVRKYEDSLIGVLQHLDDKLAACNSAMEQEIAFISQKLS